MNKMVECDHIGYLERSDVDFCGRCGDPLEIEKAEVENNFSLSIGGLYRLRDRRTVGRVVRDVTSGAKYGFKWELLLVWV